MQKHELPAYHMGIAADQLFTAAEVKPLVDEVEFQLGPVAKARTKSYAAYEARLADARQGVIDTTETLQGARRELLSLRDTGNALVAEVNRQAEELAANAGTIAALEEEVRDLETEADQLAGEKAGLAKANMELTRKLEETAQVATAIFAAVDHRVEMTAAPGPYNGWPR